MKHRALCAVLAVLLVFALVSCDAMLGMGNFFSTPLKVDEASLAKTSLSDLADLTASPSFFTALATDQAAKKAVLDNLDTVIATSTDPAEKAQAAQLATEVLIYTTPAGDLITNLGDALFSGALAGGDEGGETDFLKAIMPPSVMDKDGNIADENAFKAMINAFDDSYDYFVTFSQNFDETKYSDTELGDMAATALIASAIKSIETPAGYATKGDFMLALIDGSYTGDFQMGNIGEDDNLSALFTASGLGAFFGGSGE